MKTLTIHIPTFKQTEVNKKEDGSLRSRKEIIKEEISIAIDAFMSSPDEDADFILICGKEKLDNGDCQYGIAVMPINANNDSEFVKVQMPNFTTLPIIFIDNGKEAGKVIERVLNNYAFA
jgi:hypothetical protein